MKEVKIKPSPEVIKSILLDTINNSKKPIILTKQYDISPQLLTYYLSSLKSKNIIRKLEKGHWEIVKGYLELATKREARGHGFIWIIKFHKKSLGWDKREEILTKLNIPFIKTGNTIRIEIKGKKVWLNNKSIIIYENKSFFDSIPIQTRRLAIYELIETIKSLESKIKINLGKYNFTTKREHIAWVKDNLAIQCNLEGQKIKVFDKGENWMEVDNSNNEDETEFYKTPSFSAVTESTGYNNYYNSLKKNNWLATDFTLEMFNKLTNAQIQTNTQIQQFNLQIKSHLALIKEYRKENIAWRKSEVKKIKDNLNNGTQTKLSEF